MQQSETIADHFHAVIVRAGDEGVPICAIARMMQLPGNTVRTVLHEAKENGQLLDIPREDWPPGTRREQRLPSNLQAKTEEEMETYCRTVFGLTPLQSAVVNFLLQRNYATKEMIHVVIEQRRMSRVGRPNNMEETSIKMVDVVICNLRKRLSRYDLEISTLRNVGYSMPKDNRERAINSILEYSKDH